MKRLYRKIKQEEIIQKDEKTLNEKDFAECLIYCLNACQQSKNECLNVEIEYPKEVGENQISSIKFKITYRYLYSSKFVDMCDCYTKPFEFEIAYLIKKENIENKEFKGILKDDFVKMLGNVSFYFYKEIRNFNEFEEGKFILNNDLNSKLIKEEKCLEAIKMILNKKKAISKRVNKYLISLYVRYGKQGW